MATIEGILKISDEDVNGEIETATSSNKSNNISLYPYTTDIKSFIENMSFDNKSFSGATVTRLRSTPAVRHLRFGALLTDGTRREKYNGMLFSSVALFLSITGTDIISIDIYFDGFNNQYPKSYIYNDGTTMRTVTGNTSNKISIRNMNAGYRTFTIAFTTWNLSNTPVGITYIGFPSKDVTLTKAQIISFESQAQAITSTSGLNYGVVATTGKIRLKDTNNKLYEDAKKGYLNAFLFTLDLRVNSKSVQTHISTDSPLYTSDKQIDLELTDVLATWDNIQVSDNLPTFNVGQTLYDVVVYLATFYDGIDVATMCSGYTVVGNVGSSVDYREEIVISTYLQDIAFTQNTTLESGTLREQFEKVCTCAQLFIYVNRANQIKFGTARPNFSHITESKIIKIPFSKQYTRPSYDLLVSNRYQEIEFK